MRLAPEGTYIDSWQGPCVKDPFELPLQTQLDLLLAVDAAMRQVKGVTLSETDMQFRKIDTWFASSSGSQDTSTASDFGLRHRGHGVSGRRDPEALVSK